MVFFISILAGLCFSIIGIGYKLGAKGNVYPIQTVSALSVTGMIFFGLRSDHSWEAMPWQIFALGAVIGVTQYAAIRLLRKALTLGPLSPAWCAASLAFVPVIIYSAVFMKEPLSVLQFFSLFATGGAIVAASLGNKSTGPNARHQRRDKFFYGVLLVAILGFASIINIGLKFASTLPSGVPELSLLERYSNQLMTLIYLFILLPAALDLSLSRSWRFNRYFYWAGLLAATGGIVGYALQISIMNAPAVIVFALSSSASILFASVTSTLAFHEKRSKSWYWTLLFSILAIVLNR